MAREKEKSVEVTVGEGDKAKKVKVVVRRPGAILNNRAKAVFNKWLHTFMRDGIMTKVELDKYMEEKGIWSEEKKNKETSLAKEIRSLTKDLYQGGGKRKASEGKRIAVEIKKKRNELQNLIAEKISLEQNTAESLADNMKFDFLVSECTYEGNGIKKVYKDLEDYSEKADDEVAFVAAATLAQMLYSLDPNFEADLPENQFLSKFNYVDENFNLLDDQGHTVSLDGKMIDDLGYYVNDDGEKVDADGNLVDETGNLIMSTEYTEDTPKKRTRSNGKKKEDSV